MQSPLPIPGPLTLGQLLDRAFRLYRSHFGLSLLTAAIFMVPYGLLSGIVTGQATTGYIEFMQSMALSPNRPPEVMLPGLLNAWGTFMGSIVLLTLIGIFVNAIVTLALTNQHIAILGQSSISLWTSIRQGLSRFWAYIGMNLAMIGAMILSVLVVGGILFCSIFGFFSLFGALGGLGGGSFGSSDPFGSIVSLIGIFVLISCLYILFALLFIGPVIYLSSRWLVVVPGLVEQKWGPLEALRQSWDLTNGYVWRSIGYMILLSLLSVVVYVLPSMVIQQLMFYFLPLGEIGFVTGMASVIGTLFSVLWQPFFVAAILFFYYDLRVRKEGYDISLRIQQLESSLQPPTLPNE